MEHIVRSTLNLRQYENTQTGTLLYVNEDDKDFIEEIERDNRMSYEWKYLRTILTTVTGFKEEYIPTIKTEINQDIR